MWLICPDPTIHMDWKSHVELCAREGDIDAYVRRVAPYSVEGNVHVYHLALTLKQISPPQFAKYKTTKDGEVVPF